jgi:DNA-binding NarL/FixJ family response regulator
MPVDDEVSIRRVRVRDPIFRRLTSREREVLTLLTEGPKTPTSPSGWTSAEKTVRNHVSSVFDKPWVWSGAQAIVFARDRGFGTS